LPADLPLPLKFIHCDFRGRFSGHFRPGGRRKDWT